MRRERKERALAWALAVLAAAGALAATAATAPAAGDGAAIEHFRQQVRDLLAPKATKGVFAGTGGWLFLRSEMQGAAGLGPWIGTRPREAVTSGAPVEELDAERSDALAAVEDLAAQAVQRERGAGRARRLQLPPQVAAVVARRRLLDEPEARTGGEAGGAEARGDLARREAGGERAPVGVLRGVEGLAVRRRAGAGGVEQRREIEQRDAAPGEPGEKPPLRFAEAERARVGIGEQAVGIDLELRRDEDEEEWQAAPAELRSPGGDSLAATVDRASPLLLLGDSSSVVYHETYRAGLADHLANALGQPVDLLGVTAGGANGAREALARRGVTSGGLDGKKFVVWVVSGRLLYEYPAWQKIEVAPELPRP